MESDTQKISKEEITSLLEECDDMLEILERNSVWNENEYQKNRSIFISEYTKWYRNVLPIIRDLIPERAEKFQSIFRTTKRSGINDYTYTIQDYIHGIYLEKRLKVYSDNITGKRLKEQKDILMDAIPRINGFSFDIHRFVKINPINTNQTSFSANDTTKLLNLELDDEHYRELKNEINATYKNGLHISTFMLSRKLIENLMLDLLKTRYPPVSDENIDLYFDREHKVHRDFNVLLDTFDKRKREMPVDTDQLDDFIKELSLFRLKENTSSHSIDKIPDQIKNKKYNLEDIVEGLLDINTIIEEEGTVTK